MTKKLAVIGSALALAVVVAGCGGDDGATADRPDQPAKSESANPADQAAAEAALLTLDDFPAGWEAQPTKDDDDDEESQRRIAECVGVEYEELYSPDSASADSKSFVSADDEEITNSVRVAADESWAADAFAIASGEKFRECMLEETKKAVEEAVADEDDIEIGEPSINEISFDDFGDETLALRLTIPLESQGLSLEAIGDFVLVRIGRAQTMITTQSTGTPFDVEALAGFTKVAADRLTGEFE